MNYSSDDFTPKSRILLGHEDPDPVLIANPDGQSPILLLGDHAGRAIPKALDSLNLSPFHLDLHIALDIGIEGLGLALSDLLDATFIHQAYSRLVIDSNRDPGSSTSITSVSDEIPIPGNHAISDTERRQRHDEIFRPYHASIAAELDRRAAQHRRTIVASLHSFTPSMGGISRPWTFGVLHGYDCAFSDDVLAELQRRSPQSVGDNEPYALNAQDYTVPLHAQKRGLDYVELEVRQDTIRKARDQSDVAATLAEVFQYALTRRAA